MIGPPGEGRDDHRQQRDGGQEDDVDLRMAEDPEQMLPQKRIAAARRVEERPVEHALHLEQQVAGDQRREGEQDHARDDQQVPGEERHEVDPHARRAAFHDADDEFDSRGDRSDLDEGKAKQPDIGADARLFGGGQRRVHEPARRRRSTEEDRAADEDAANQETPESESSKPRKWQFARAQHGRQQEDRHRLENRHGEEKHHHRAMQRKGLVVEVGRNQVVFRHGQLGSHEQRQQARKEHEGEGRRTVPETDLGIVDRRPVAPAGRDWPTRREAVPPRRPCLAQPKTIRSLEPLQPDGDLREVVRGQMKIGGHLTSRLERSGMSNEPGHALRIVFQQSGTERQPRSHMGEIRARSAPRLGSIDAMTVAAALFAEQPGA